MNEGRYSFLKVCVVLAGVLAGVTASAFQITGETRIVLPCGAAAPVGGHIFSMSCKVNSLNGAFATPEGREKAVRYFRRNHVTKLWLESYRHTERVSVERLKEVRDAFRAEGFETCGMVTPTQLNTNRQMVCCWTDPYARRRLREEVEKAVSVFDCVIMDDFLFTSCECPRCQKAKKVSGAKDWGEFRCNLLYDVCEKEIVRAAKAVNPKVHLIIKYPCWYKGYGWKGYDPVRETTLFGECWIGTETRDANPNPLQACWIIDWMDRLTKGRCGGGWYDPLDSTPEKFVEQARYTILGGARESLIHCYDYLAANDPGTTPFGEKTGGGHACAAAHEQEVEGLVKLAALLQGTERGRFEMMTNRVSRHCFTRGRQTLVAYQNTSDASQAVDGIGECLLALPDAAVWKDGRLAPHGFVLFRRPTAKASAFQITGETRIVLPAKADAHGLHQTFREAAEALVSDVKEATGLKISYVTADKAKDAKGAIWFGEAAAERAGLVPKGLKGCDCVVAEKDGELYLFGRDRSGRKNDEGASWYSATIPTVRAVTVFEETFMGVAYLGPGVVGREVPKRERIEVPAGTFIRNDSFLESGIGRISDLMNSVANANIGGGAWRVHGGHIFPTAFQYKKNFKEHPEYFALLGDSRAQGDPNDPAVCISNPGARQVLIDEILKEFDEGAEVVELGQNDGYDFCQCEKCKAYGGKVSNGEKFWIFFRDIAEELYRLRPGKTVEITAYGPTYEPPKTFREFPPNVMIEMMRYSPQAFETWKNYKVPRGFAVYIYLWGSYYKLGSTVLSSIPQVADTARLFRENGVRGIYRCGSYELFGTEGPSYYVFAKLLNDPTRDEWKVFDEYCKASYGPAAEAMSDFHRMLDIRVSGYVKTAEGFPPRPGRIMARPSWLSTPEESLLYIYTPTAMKALNACLVRAEGTEGLSEKQKTRIALVRLEFDYACHIGRVLTLYNAFRLCPTKELFEPLADAVEARTRFIESLFDEKGRIKRFPGWKEVSVLGDAEKAELMQNGHLAATLGAPFNWDVVAMRKSGVIPNGAVKKTSAVRVTAKPALGDFTAGALAAAPENPLAGMQFDKVDFASSFKLAYDDENLYVAVKAELPAHLEFKPQGHDGVCYRQDCFELYIDPTFAHEHNFHFIWNAVPDSCLDRAYGLHTDPLDPKFKTFDMNWDGKWTYETKREGAVWHSLVTMPFSTLEAKKPLKGDKWYLNLGRESFPEDKNNITQLSLWSPSLEGGGLEDREAMGVVTFE